MHGYARCSSRRPGNHAVTVCRNRAAHRRRYGEPARNEADGKRTMISNADIGLVGLGVMGRNMALNFADHGYVVAGYDTDSEKVDTFNKASEKNVGGFGSMKELAAALKKPRSLMMLVPAGKPVDAVIEEAVPYMDRGDLIIDAGNSHYTDTERRIDKVAEKGLHFMGMGVSGGEKGARYGPSMMPGGNEEAYERVKPLFEAAAAHVNGEPCVVYLGKRSAGHYVKMVHNGIEYAVMQLIAETYDLMKRLLGLDNDRVHEIFGQWNREELAAYLIEITSAIFSQPDEESSNRLIDVIADEAKQKGTGMWTCQDAMDLQVPVPTLDMAVAMRNLSALKKLREAGQKRFPASTRAFGGNREGFIQDLKYGLYACMILSYAQGMAVLSSASRTYKYNLRLQDVARIWRGGCIIRAAILDDISEAYTRQPDLDMLIFDDKLREVLDRHMPSVRKVVETGIGAGIPIPAFATSLAYFDGLRSAWLPANLIQAQRDYFGSHTYERIDRKGTFHTNWNEG
ncbi:MAG: NADP-dependent phosphogluconate dehydrogenase [Deltaproteobacteria bacterium]